MFCSNCGTEICDGSFFCSKCGAKIENGNSVSEKINQIIEPNSKELPKFSTRFHMGKKILISVIIFIVLTLMSAVFEPLMFVVIIFPIAFLFYLLITYCNFVKDIENQIRDLGDIRGIQFDYFLSRIEMPKRNHFSKKSDICVYRWLFCGWHKVNYYLYVDCNGIIVDTELVC